MLEKDMQLNIVRFFSKMIIFYAFNAHLTERAPPAKSIFNADESLISEKEDKLYLHRIGAKGRAAGVTRGGSRGKTVGTITPFVSATGSTL